MVSGSFESPCGQCRFSQALGQWQDASQPQHFLTAGGLTDA